VPLAWQRTVPLLQAAPLLLFMSAFYAVPVLSMLMRSISDPVWTLSHYASMTGDTVFLKIFCNTLYTSCIVTLGTLVLGYPVALTLVRAPRWAPLILVLILLPFWTSVLVRSYAWMAIANALRQIDPSLARASSGLGATPSATFRQITLPLSMPGVAAGVLLVFVLALGFYITPAMVGGPRGITRSMLIAQQVDQLNWAYVATLSAVLLTTSLAIIAAFHPLAGFANALRMSAR
jgi:ABC-type spermidine/putrescine transport system permease subunit I